MLGRPQPGLEAGRFREFDYENLGCEGERDSKVDLRKFWVPGTSESGLACGFAWEDLKSSELAWTLNRPDVYVCHLPVVLHLAFLL